MRRRAVRDWLDSDSLSEWAVGLALLFAAVVILYDHFWS